MWRSTNQHKLDDERAIGDREMGMGRNRMGRRAIAMTGIFGLISSLAMTVVGTPRAEAAQPVPGHTRIANEIVRTNMPRITGGEIFDLEYIGNRVFVVGTFTSIRNNAGNNTTNYNQSRVASFNLDTGLVDANFRPTFGSSVDEIEASPDGTKLFVVGRFNTVNGVTKRKIASINPVTGATIAGFTATANSQATAIEATNTTVYVGGNFTTVNNVARTGLVALNATTGAVITGFTNNLSGGIGVSGLLTVQQLVLSPDDSKLLVVHTGRQINGQNRYGVALIDTTTNQLLPWHTRLWEDNIQFVGGIQRIYAGAISPNGQYFVVGSGSGGDRPPISDTAVAFSMNGGANQEPLWISRAFDSIYSVAISEIGVYIGGHFNYLESPTAPDPWPGLDNVGYGRGQGLGGYGLGDDIVIRDHVGLIDPVYGKALEWNPGSNSFEGNKAMLVHPRGVITGGDATTQGGQNVGRIAFYDFNNIPAVGQNETTIVTPIEGRVEEPDIEFMVEGTGTATSGVRRVQLEVRDRDRGQYLQDNLTTWGGANTINVNLASPNATSTNWSLPLTISGNRRIQLWAKTYGLNNTSDSSKASKKIETFGLVDDTPTTNISSPSGSVIPTTTFTVIGTASDDVGVNSITFSLRDAQNRYLQDDGTVDTVYNTFRGEPDVIGATSATWSYEFTVPFEGEWTMQAIAVDTAGQSDIRSADRGWLVSSTAVAPSVTITAPASMVPPTAIAPLSMSPGSPLTFAGTATDDEGLNRVQITLSNSTTRENLGADGTWGTEVLAGSYRVSGPNDLPGTTYNWSYTTPFNLRPGTYTFRVTATDDLDLTTSNALRGNLTINVQVPGDAFPDSTLNVTGTQPLGQVLHLDLSGRATDDNGIVAVRLSVRDRVTSRYIQPDGSLAAAFALLDANLTVPGSTNTTFLLPVDLPIAGDYDVVAYAYDTADQVDPSTAGATARYPVFPGDLPPTVTENLLAPVDGAAFTDSKIFVSGRLEDDNEIAQAHVAIRNSAGLYMDSIGNFPNTTISWRTAFINSPGSPGSNFSYTTPVIPNGTYTVLVRGQDARGFTTPVPSQRTVTVTGPTNNLPPVASFTSSCVENFCSFDGRSSTDESFATLVYSWNFGSGSGSGPVPTRRYTTPGTYTVTLTVRDQYNLTAVTSQSVVVVEPTTNLPPVPVINPPSCIARVCNMSGIGTADPNLGDTFTYLWSFGDGSPTSTSSAPAKTYATDGDFTITLTVTDGWGEAATTSYVVSIHEPVGNAAPMPVINPVVCAARACTLYGTGSTDPDGDTFAYLWNFGDGSATSTSSAPAKTFAADGSYTVTLTLTDMWANVASTTRVVTLTEPPGNLAPVPVIPAPTCVLKTCTFSANGSSDPEGDPYTYLWNFGDGTATSTLAGPTKTYAADGTYTVTLTLTDAWGNVGTITRAVTIAEPPGNSAPTPVIDTPACTVRTCTFSGSGSSDPNGDTFTYIWNFGDGTPVNTTATPTKTYVADGSYTVSLTLTDVWGDAATVTRVVTIAEPASNVAPIPVIGVPTCGGRTCTISGLGSSDPNGNSFTYLWSFGDVPATSSTVAAPVKTYAADGTYTITLTVTDAWGDFATTTRDLTITEPVTNAPPVPVINTPTCSGRVCTISGVGTTDPNGDAYTYLWNYGDGTATSTTAASAHTFPLAGTYTVSLTATDWWGDATTITRDVTITEPVDNVAPVAVIVAPTCNVRVCTLSGLGSYDPNGDAFTYLWVYGDATANGTTQSSAHTFPTAGTYPVTLTVTDVWGKFATATVDITIVEPPTNVAPIPVIGTPSCVALVCTISGTGSSDPNADPFTYLWDFGDATPTSATSSNSHTFPAAGTYTVTLTVTDVWGDFATTTRDVTVA
jgi:PKD repeat protein